MDSQEEIPFEVSQQDDLEAVQSTTTQKKKKVVCRGRSWTTAEDVLLCQCWLDVSQDEIHGNVQKPGSFFERVKVRLLECDPKLPRTAGSIKSRWGVINRAVSKFCGYLVEVQTLQQGGTTDKDAVEQAKEMYIKAENEKKFAFEECWKVLHVAPKWQLHNDSLSSSGPSTPTTPVAPILDPDPLNYATIQPDGKEKPLETRRKRAIDDEWVKQICEGQRDIVSAINEMKEDSKVSRALWQENQIQCNEERKLEKELKQNERARKNALIEKQMEMITMQMDMQKRLEEERQEKEKRQEVDRQRREDQEILAKNLAAMDEFESEYWTNEKRKVIMRMRATEQ